MNIKKAINDLKRRKEYLENTSFLLNENKKDTDKTRSIDNTIGYILKNKISISYKIR